jgi:hypothetical protein
MIKCDLQIHVLNEDYINKLIKHSHGVFYIDYVDYHSKKLERDTIYINTGESSLPINVVSNIEIPVDPNDPGIYEGLILHLTTGGDRLLFIRNNHTPEGYESVAIKYGNGILCYYIPSLQSFVFGNIVWHVHYVDIVFANLWPKLLKQFNITIHEK